MAIAAKIILGAFWYSPIAFAGPWSRLAGITQEQMKTAMPKALPVDVVSAILMAFVLVHAIRYAGAHGIGQGAAVGFFNWLGFVAATHIAGVFWERRPFGLFVINSGYQLVSLLIMGGILATWI
ncbi:MAG TPA: DUF1761 domain-containing protein [Stellaceae bacterium]|nr:DUF1761 domain-containing protein [Stellaceae bacterium]